MTKPLFASVEAAKLVHVGHAAMQCDRQKEACDWLVKVSCKAPCDEDQAVVHNTGSGWQNGKALDCRCKRASNRGLADQDVSDTNLGLKRRCAVLHEHLPTKQSVVEKDDKDSMAG